MLKILAVIATFLGFHSVVLAEELAYNIDYDKMSLLDAESLAEQGIKDAYSNLNSEFKKYVENPEKITEILNASSPSYQLKFRERIYDIYSPDQTGSEGQSWGRATYAFFDIVNSQLDKSETKFYALYGGNDLGGIFLTQAEYDSAIKSLPNKRDWPYIPSLVHPGYGQKH